MANPQSFFIEKLALVGTDVSSAEVAFMDGLNIIEGASDTGKSYVLAAIEWCLGARTRPKVISEADGYEYAVLTIRVRESGVVWSLRRSLAGGAIAATSTEPGSRPTRLAPQHSAKNENNVSTLLLRLCGADGKLVRKNKRGETVHLTFPILRKLAFVDEHRIIFTGSAFSSGQRTDVTKYRSTMRFLLTGLDDSGIVANEPKEVIRARTDGRVAALEEVLASLKNEAGMHEAPEDGALESVQEEIEEIQKELSAAGSSFNEVQDVRRRQWETLRIAQSRYVQVTSLIERFRVLSDHYDSDIERMGSSAEAAILLGAVPEGACLLCGADGEHAVHHAKAPPDFLEACTAEQKKVRRLKSDLEDTIRTLVADAKDLKTTVDAGIDELREIDVRIATRLRPVQRNLRLSLHSVLERRAKIERHTFLTAQISRLEALRARPPRSTETASTNASSSFPNHAPTDALAELAEEIEHHLREWRFSDGCRVDFDTNADDVVIDGKSRGDFGKGHRAVAHAACTIALMTLARKTARAHPGVVILDSPLNPYRGAIDDDGQLSEQVKESFLKTLEKNLGNRQVIVLDNDLPKVTVEAQRIAFTKSRRHGRYGFFPVGKET